MAVTLLHGTNRRHVPLIQPGTQTDPDSRSRCANDHAQFQGGAQTNLDQQSSQDLHSQFSMDRAEVPCSLRTKLEVLHRLEIALPDAPRLKPAPPEQQARNPPIVGFEQDAKYPDARRKPGQ